MNPSARAACAWCRSTDAGAIRHPAPRRPSTAWWCTPRRQAARAAPRRHGAVHLRPPAGLPDLSGQRRLRAAGHGRRGRPARGALRLPGRQPPGQRQGRVQSVLHLRPVQVHRLQPLRARLRGNPGHLRPDHLRQGLRIARVARPGPAVPGQRMRVLRRLRAGLPHVHAAGKDRHHDGPGRALGDHHLRLLRRGLRFQGRDEGPGSGAHGALEGRPGQPWPFLRKGPLRLGLRHAQGTRAQAHDPPAHHRPVARGVMGRGHQPRGLGIPPHPGAPRARRRRRHHLIALHQRGNLAGAETGARGLRHQQRRHLRPRLPLAHRLRPEADAGRIGRHPDLRFGHAHRRGDRDGRQPQQRPPGVRLAPEAPAAPGRAPDRDRSAPYRAGQLAAHQGRLPPAGAARHQHGAAVLAGARHRHREPDRRGLRRRALRGKGVREWRDFVSLPENSPEAMEEITGVPARDVRRGAALRHRRQRLDLLRPGRHRAQPGIDHRDGHRQPRHGHRQRGPRGWA